MRYHISEYNGAPCQVADYVDPKTGHLIGQKIRMANKQFVALGDVTGSLYGMHLYGAGGKQIVVCEGEVDAVSYAQAHPGWPVVSVPNGAAGARKALEKHVEWLEKFDSIILAFDNDAPGRAAANECYPLFTPGKVKLAKLDPTYKDFSDAVQAKDSKAILTAIWNAEPVTPAGIVRGSDLWEVISGDGPVVTTARYPWQGLNNITLGLRKGELVTITAGSGVGKSAVCREIAYEAGQHQGFKVGLLFLEESVRKTALTMLGLHVEKRLHIFPDAVSEDAKKEAFSEVFNRDNFFFYDHFGSVAIADLLSRIRFLAIACKCDFIILDHISIVVSGLEVNDERKAIDVAMTKLRTLVQETGVGMIVVSHLKRVEGKRGHEDGERVSLSHLRGSQSIAQLSDMVLALNRVEGEDHEVTNKLSIEVLKNRFSGEIGEATTLFYNPDTGRLSESELSNEFFPFFAADDTSTVSGRSPSDGMSSDCSPPF